MDRWFLSTSNITQSQTIVIPVSSSMTQKENFLFWQKEGLPLQTISCTLVTLSSAIVVSLVLILDPPQCVHCTEGLGTRLPFHM